MRTAYPSVLKFFVKCFSYPEYEIISSDDISKTTSTKNRKSEEALIGIIVDIHFLSISDHLVCTFSSQVGTYQPINLKNPSYFNIFIFRLIK